MARGSSSSSSRRHGRSKCGGLRRLHRAGTARKGPPCSAAPWLRLLLPWRRVAPCSSRAGARARRAPTAEVREAAAPAAYLPGEAGRPRGCDSCLYWPWSYQQRAWLQSWPSRRRTEHELVHPSPHRESPVELGATAVSRVKSAHRVDASVEPDPDPCGPADTAARRRSCRLRIPSLPEDGRTGGEKGTEEPVRVRERPLQQGPTTPTATQLGVTVVKRVVLGMQHDARAHCTASTCDNILRLIWGLGAGWATPRSLVLHPKPGVDRSAQTIVCQSPSFNFLSFRVGAIIRRPYRAQVLVRVSLALASPLGTHGRRVTITIKMFQTKSLT